nr:GPI-anchored hemophore cfmA-like [Procambarus clarkii]
MVPEKFASDTEETEVEQGKQVNIDNRIQNLETVQDLEIEREGGQKIYVLRGRGTAGGTTEGRNTGASGTVPAALGAGQHSDLGTGAGTKATIPVTTPATGAPATTTVTPPGGCARASSAADSYSASTTSAQATPLWGHKQGARQEHFDTGYSSPGLSSTSIGAIAATPGDWTRSRNTAGDSNIGDTIQYSTAGTSTGTRSTHGNAPPHSTEDTASRDGPGRAEEAGKRAVGAKLHIPWTQQSHRQLGGPQRLATPPGHPMGEKRQPCRHHTESSSPCSEGKSSSRKKFTGLTLPAPQPTAWCPDNLHQKQVQGWSA